MKFAPQIFIRNREYEDLWEKFFLAAVAAILGIRFFLKLTDYPQISPRGLHIAHMLWGGLLMLLAILSLLFFLDRRSKKLAAVIGGLGFGAFIDEVGKFITSDNNYFYQPAAAIIYVIFVLIYLGIYSFKKYSRFSSQENLINSLELLKEAVVRDLDKEEKQRGLRYLRKVKEENIIYHTLKNLYQELEALPYPKQRLLDYYWRRLKFFYSQLIQQKWFTGVVKIFFLIQAIVSFFSVTLFTFGTFSFIFTDSLPFWLNQLRVSDYLSLGASALSGLFIIYGVFKMRYSRLQAYLQFKKSMLVSIFLVQVFVFYKDQFSAFFGLVFDLVVLSTLNYMIEREISNLNTGNGFKVPARTKGLVTGLNLRKISLSLNCVSRKSGDINSHF